MNKKGLLSLLIIFIFMLIVNMMTPLLSDDYFVAFVWPEGVGINGTLPTDARKVSSLSDVLESLKVYYFVWGGRIPGQSFITIFSWWGKVFFNFVNAFMTVLLIAEIYWITHEGKISLNFIPAYVMWIFFALWSFNAAFVDTFLWLAGSCDYLWLMVLILAFLLPYIQDYYNPAVHKQRSIIFTLGIFVLGILAGCSRENAICWVILALLYWFYLCWGKTKLQEWKVLGLIGLCIGYTLLVLSPGSLSRLTLLNKLVDSKVLFSLPTGPKLTEVIIIITFHVFLWHFIVNFFLRYKNALSSNQPIIQKYWALAEVSALIAFFSGLVMSLIPCVGSRNSFVSLIFLIIAAALIFRIGEITGMPVVNETFKVLMKYTGCFYFAITITVSLIGNYLNYKDWHEVLRLVRLEKKNPTNIVLEVHPYHTESNHFKSWLYLSGNHMVWNPLSKNEKNEINISFSRYYGIKGIKVSEK
ncbi:hypothetical protein SAMN04487864_101382 [Succiniclasticum ruminis]|uniref:Uncharacterized protein n=1 Tax=Succiniclasticum ruminis TaxID=40841 RepID=A0A1G6I263_9FIRM|nr:DUF6056 family protein [Succiniclasticum ruminis]SDC00165.1 hypothetical protein SAMN04487864_101382 [Succiniclasticum ruminis]